MRMRVCLVLLVLAVVAGLLLPSGKQPIPIGRETTHVDGPFDSEGGIDFTAAINARFGEGVTPANNAMAKLWDAIGVDPDAGHMPAGYFEALGTRPRKAVGFLPLEVFLSLRLGVDLNDRATLDVFRKDLVDRLTRTSLEDDGIWLADWVKANKEALDLAVESSRRPRFFSPVVDLFAELPPTGSVTPQRFWAKLAIDLAKALAARSLLRAGDGDADAAWADLLACFRLGRLMGQGATPWEAYWSFEIERVACRAVPVHIDRCKPDAARLAACVRDLRALPPLADLRVQVGFTERLCFLAAAQEAHRHRPSKLLEIGPKREWSPATKSLGWMSVDLRETLREANRHYDSYEMALGPGTRKERKDRLWELVRAMRMKTMESWEVLSVLQLWAGDTVSRGRRVGNLLMPSWLPLDMTRIELIDSAGQESVNVLAAFGLEAHHRRHGQYPAALAELGEVPPDFLADAPLRYRQEGDGYLLWSVGRNGQDQDGHGENDDPKGDDIAVRMPVPGRKEK